MSNPAVYTIRTLSNLHAGAGNRSFGIIDKHVQRDPTDKLPIVFGSSVKGALREMVEGQPNGKSVAGTLFGADNPKGGSAKLRQGQLIISDARLLALPVRSSHGLFYWATTKSLLSGFLDDLDNRLVEIEATAAIADIVDGNEAPKSAHPWLLVGDRPTTKDQKDKEVKQDVYLEFWCAADPPEPATDEHKQALTELIGPRLALLHDDDLQVLVKDLPVLARNSLNNGISTQLWYEEIVPREAIFYCFVDSINSEDAVKVLTERIDNGIVQVGGNATVGYGRTEWTLQNPADHA